MNTMVTAVITMALILGCLACGSSAQSYQTCSSVSVTDSNSCNSWCVSRGAQLGVYQYSTCGCSNGNACTDLGTSFDDDYFTNGGSSSSGDDDDFSIGSFGNYPTCTSVSVTDSNSCNSWCSSTGAQLGIYSYSTCGCSNARACTDLSTGSIGSGDIGSYGNYPTCSSNGVSDSNTCNSWCQSTGAQLGIYQEQYSTCGCSNARACTDLSVNTGSYSYAVCTNVGVSSTSSCNSWCQSSGAQLGIFLYNACGCSNGNACIPYNVYNGYTGSGSITDDDDGFTAPNFSSGSAFPSCSGEGVSDASTCTSWCQSNGAQIGVYQEDYSSCGCSNGNVCIPFGNTASGNTQDGSSSSTDNDGMSFLVNSVVQQIPTGDQSRCESVVQGAISSTLYNCIDSNAFDDDDGSGDDDDDGSFASTLCENTCFGAAFGAAQTLANEGCIPGGELFEAESIAAQGNYLNLLCSRGGNGYCGDLASILGSLFDSQSDPTMEQCQTIANYGRCAGSFIDVFENRLETLPEEITSGIPSGSNFTAFGESLVEACGTTYSIDLAASVDGTEASANLASTSGAFSVTVSAFAMLAAAIVAMLF